ncbi:hypothetical protein CVU82_04410 [Candidatus Falkowbacteria bacterium HGW-Falkowbacteria-1]|uniref:Fibrobacter succinogenes major paralogous domain-containing protein n=1 Tax=Candidatus Falkowbacteria bacterium HGW-Falkowbacteria-1 TaxID=2013768 RepID=A0A2N2E8K5_9BACT|nr:MAG: hypothetical protein CVU82_04410 [Candidatus Falkowbacteria bacterium HGW-Falkowbacteria-1]
MYNIPTAPSPADGDCLEASNTYAYVPQNDGASYTIDFCTGKQISDLLAGAKCLTPGGITNCGESAPPPPSWACGDLLTDTRDSYAYQTVQIGAQCWFKENLKYLPVVHSNSEFEARGTSQLPGYGVYAYDGSDVPTAKLSANYINYGVLYNWYAVDQASICPTGWHVPSDAEFLELEEFVDSGNYENWCDPIGEPGDCGGFWYNAGGYLKQIGTAYWNSPNSGATDAYDFTALPAGWRGSLADGGSLSLTDFWSSSAFDSIDSWRRHITYSGPEILRDNFRAFYGLSVRCLEN